MTETKLSPRLSFEGYSFKKALYRNKNELKALLAVIVGYNFVGGVDLQKLLLSLATAGLALSSKLVWDAFDYYFTEVKVEE